MNVSNTSPWLGLCALLASSLTGCIVNAGSDPVTGAVEPLPETGTISVLSTIDGSTYAPKCDYAGAAELELKVYDGSELYSVAVSSCYDFRLEVALPDGRYTADATLLDGSSKEVSKTLILDDLRIVTGTDLRVDIDFPTSKLVP